MFLTVISKDTMQEKVFFHSSKVDDFAWHKRLGYPRTQVLKLLRRDLNLELSIKRLFVLTACMENINI